MHIYILGTMFSALFALLATYNWKRFDHNRKLHALHRRPDILVLIFLSMLPLATLSAVRFDVGVDFRSYQQAYDTFRFETSYFEIGTRLLISTLRGITSNPQIFFFVTSFFICISYYLAIYKNSFDPVYSIVLFLFTTEYFRTMSWIRQYMALAIIIHAFPAIRDGKFKKVLFYTVIGMAFHTSALIILPLYVLCRIHLKIGSMLLFSGIFGAICLYYSDSIKKLLQWFIRSFGFNRYTWYFDSYFKRNVFNPFITAIYVVFLLLCCYLYYFQRTNNKTLDLVSNSAFLGVALCISRIILPVTVARMVYYIDSILVIYSPELFGLIKNDRLRFVVKAVALICYAAVLFLSPNETSYNILPYQTIWQHALLL